MKFSIFSILFFITATLYYNAILVGNLDSHFFAIPIMPILILMYAFLRKSSFTSFDLLIYGFLLSFFAADITLSFFHMGAKGFDIITRIATTIGFGLIMGVFMSEKNDKPKGKFESKTSILIGVGSLVVLFISFVIFKVSSVYSSHFFKLVFLIGSIILAYGRKNYVGSRSFQIVTSAIIILSIEELVYSYLELSEKANDYQALTEPVFVIGIYLLVIGFIRNKRRFYKVGRLPKKHIRKATSN